jgi:CRISPR-associated protein Cas2
MQGTKWWLVCYDVRDPDRLRKTAKLLEGYGERIQYSVFRCFLTIREREKLRWELTSLLKSEDDVLFIPVCGDCVKGVCTIHQREEELNWPDAPARYEII